MGAAPDRSFICLCFWLDAGSAKSKTEGCGVAPILSDHADWPDLLHTLKQISPKEVWITHGREDALLHACNKLGIEARACLGWV